MKRFVLKIYRGHPNQQYWETFELPLRSGENVISALMEIQRSPVTSEGKKVTPVVWEDGCLEEVCGSCSMLINGIPRQACTALIENYTQTGNHTVTIAPLTKFPLVRDLVVNRDQMFDNLKQIRGWIESRGSRAEGFGPPMSQAQQKLAHSLATCMTCGCCSEACPQINTRSQFIGPAAISQARLFNAHPTSQIAKRHRLRVLMKEGGISDCGNAQNCVQVCPKNLPLTESIAVIGREVTLQAFHDLLHFHDT